MTNSGINSPATPVTRTRATAHAAVNASAHFKPRPIVAAIQASIIGLGLGLGLVSASAQAAEIVVTSNRDENNNGIPDAAEAKKFNVAPILLLLLDDDEAQ